MRILRRMMSVALFVCWALSGLKAVQKGDSLATEVRNSAQLILSDSAKPEDAGRGLVQLLDVANKIAAQDARLPAELRNRIRAAAKVFVKNQFGSESSEAVNGAYKTINGGKSYTFPSEVNDIRDASRIARQHIDRSVNMLETGQSDQAVRDILAFILLVTTPMMK